MSFGFTLFSIVKLLTSESFLIVSCEVFLVLLVVLVIGGPNPVSSGISPHPAEHSCICYTKFIWLPFEQN